MINKNKEILIILFLFFSLLGSFYFGEDSLGGAKHDYFFHEKFIYLFSENFKETFLKFGNEELFARNSPFFYIILSLIINIGIELEYFRYLNSLTIIPIVYFFYKCLSIKFKDINFETKILLTSVILLSPTIRSLLVWPYPLLWALLFFLISVFYYLKFYESNNRKSKIRFAIINIFLLAISAYITPNFAFFSIYFFYKFLLYFKFSKEIFLIIFLNIILSIPAISYFVITDFYFLKGGVTDINIEKKLNFFNKIVIISSIIFFYFLPFISLKKKIIFRKLKFNKKIFFLITFIFINIIFFNYTNETAGTGKTGGGIFFHLSQLLFSNSLLVFLTFIVFIYFAYIYNLIKTNNLIIFFILIIYNAQYSIYHKYFDPLIYIILMFLINFNFNKFGITFKNLSYKYISLYLFFLFISISKSFINY